MVNQVYDPWEMASNPRQMNGNGFWGKVEIDVWACALVKGIGKVPYNPGEHKEPNTAIDLAIMPIPEQSVRNQKACERHLIAESTEWQKITWASLKGLGITSLKDIKDKWAHVEPTQTGKTYESNAGEIKDKTEFKFISLFDTEEACVKDYESKNGGGAPAVEDEPAAAPDPQVAQKPVAYQFLRVIVKNAVESAGKDLEKARSLIATQIASYPVVKTTYTVDSEDTMALIMEYMK